MDDARVHLSDARSRPVADLPAYLVHTDHTWYESYKTGSSLAKNEIEARDRRVRKIATKIEIGFFFPFCRFLFNNRSPSISRDDLQTLVPGTSNIYCVTCIGQLPMLAFDVIYTHLFYRRFSN